MLLQLQLLMNSFFYYDAAVTVINVAAVALSIQFAVVNEAAVTVISVAAVVNDAAVAVINVAAVAVFI